MGNINGETLPIFAIGKSKTPRCFKGVKNLSCCYWAQPKRWILSELFEEWVKEIYQDFGAQKRKIALIIDKPAHPGVPALVWLEPIFLPLNTMSITQPMGQGVIQSLNAKYLFLAVKKQTDTLEKGN